MKTIDLDLTNLRNKSGVLVDGVPLELHLITNYATNKDNIALAQKAFVDYLYQKEGSAGTYDEVLSFMSDKRYNSIVLKFNAMLEHVLYNALDPNTRYISFKEVLQDDRDVYLVRFEYE